MTPDIKQTLLSALSQYRGDDYARASNAFRRCSEAALDEQYGQSGKTPRQILAEYAAHDAKVQAAVDYVEGAK